jgi:hypothetical protein
MTKRPKLSKIKKGSQELLLAAFLMMLVKCRGTPSPYVSPDPQGSCAVPLVLTDREAVAAQQRWQNGQEPALVRRIGASGCPV